MNQFVFESLNLSVEHRWVIVDHRWFTLELFCIIALNMTIYLLPSFINDLLYLCVFELFIPKFKLSGKKSLVGVHNYTNTFIHIEKNLVKAGLKLRRGIQELFNLFVRLLGKRFSDVILQASDKSFVDDFRVL